MKNFTLISLVVSVITVLSGQAVVEAALVSWDEFHRAVTSNGFGGPNQAQYQAFVNRMPAGAISNKQEAAMFLAQILWESGGLRYKRELICIKTGCPGRYDNSVGIKGKNYYGRGYIQLTHSYNYKAASLALYHDLRLINNPEIVADSEDAAWGTAFWFWKVHVHNSVQGGEFGRATRAINGGECTANMSAAHKRYQIYIKVRAAFHLNGNGNERGCYN